MQEDRVWLGVFLSVFLLSVLLRVDAGGDAAWAGGMRLPVFCPVKSMTGWDCPGCGLSRSFILVSHGEFARAFGVHLAGPVLYALLLLQIPYRWVMIRKKLPPEKRPLAFRWMGVAALALLLAGWVVRLAGVA